ncbi:hypothetical protein PR001_g23078 [Phytophthora rubi]|nr:hypothetical protein PR002_g23594 [Phytophthora rubi]KAE8984771.1 hypothetical protein PR001_g23078 [Phytophthora rubi]
MPSRMETKLKEMNFTHVVLQFQWDEIIMPALRHFYKVHGHTDVSYGFVVPDSDDAWPRLSWNWPLGGTVLRVRIGNGFSRQVEESKEELKKMKLCYEMTIFERDWNEKILPAADGIPPSTRSLYCGEAIRGATCISVA